MEPVFTSNNRTCRWIARRAITQEIDDVDAMERMVEE
jgi:hypothetical protein